MINVHNIVIRKHEGKRPLQKCRIRWKDNTKMTANKKKVKGCELDSHVSQYSQVEGSCEHCHDPFCCIKAQNFLAI